MSAMKTVDVINNVAIVWCKKAFKVACNFFGHKRKDGGSDALTIFLKELLFVFMLVGV